MKPTAPGGVEDLHTLARARTHICTRMHTYRKHVNCMRASGEKVAEGKKRREAFSQRIVALLSTNRWQTCVHQRAAYRPPLTCLPPPQPYCKIWIAEVYNTPLREQPPAAAPAPLPSFQRCLARHAYIFCCQECRL